MSAWRFQRNGKHVNFVMRSNGKPVRFIFADELRTFADELHDLADKLEAEGRRETERTTK